MPVFCVGAAIGILDAPAQQQEAAPALQIEIHPVPQLAIPKAPNALAQPAIPRRRSSSGPKKFDSLQAMQEEYFSLFRTKPGFGASRIMTFPVEDQLMMGGITYRFAAPDLIGLEDKPLAYHRGFDMVTMADITNRTARARLVTRPLTAEESLAVAELRSGRNITVLPIQVPIVTTRGTNEVAGLLAVGALRARTECAQCHQCKEGTLLGAFSFRLFPTNTFVPTLARVGAPR